MSEDNKNEKEWLENQITTLSEALVETAKEFNKLEKKHKELAIKFNSFAKAFLSNSDKEISNKIFKEYQKNMFKQRNAE